MNDHYTSCEPCRKSLELRTLPGRTRARIAIAVIAVAVLSGLLLLQQAPA